MNDVSPRRESASPREHLLKSKKISQKEATFCLLDQWTFECEWATLEALSLYKKSGHKIEILYFLPNVWLNRAIAAQRDKNKIERWWGRNDWSILKTTPPAERVCMFVDRFKNELGYWSVEPWPIFKNDSRNIVMYYMIHATDHPAAPHLMQRAYRKALDPPETHQALQLDIENILKTSVHSRPRSGSTSAH